MRVAVTIESFGDGGAESSTRQICEGLRDRGCAVTLLTGFAPAGRAIDGVKTEAAGERRMRSARDVRRYRRFVADRRLVGAFDTSLSVTTLCPAAVVEPRAGIYREMWATDRPGIFQRKRRAMWAAEAATLRDPSVRTWVAISRFMQRQIVRHTGRPEAEVPVIANGAPRVPPPARRTRARQRAAWGVAQDAIVFLFPSADLRRKGWPALARAWPRVVGSADRARLVALSPAVRGDAITAAGPTDDMPAALAAADVLVLPSRYDPASKVVAEALHAGLPVITTRTNGACDLIEGSAAGRILDHAGDAAALSSAMLGFCEPAALTAAREATAAAAAGATMDAHVDRLLGVLRAAARGR
ncbi:glycosyltransferase family 4 protein [Phycisphaera mikurensis]|uniref:Putative glycosyltransferase n=1 Tax=Phycisphaera mikurensis (strain NBRC 102666 / KCTC 22515 / FYK2301M01) TaxID=1142394 RepID=I0IBY7_PHYMF|nr:glycosyltransferase family 4 protein [Phycisphaera mikurensis]MBB6442001.1 UDP-glucose:(heptosyl)LPS alpha-1,3-glucosyltransferase [Phycisphaera mikurensis]BAM02775.1 putative glycosyltransferase [Phycisphaera mikurensis NBRC 102666]